MRFLGSMALGAAGLVLLEACASRPSSPSEIAENDTFVIERDFAGKTVGRGRFTSITGVDRGLTAYLDGTWDGQTLTLREDFEYDDGEKDQKTWVLTKQPDGTFSGVREDVVGEAVGFVDGSAFRLEYTVRLGGENGRKVKFRDVIYKRSDGVIVNRATVGYYGIRVGRVYLEFERTDDDLAKS
ncbi:MAG: DUF3833 family protein [Pseudomonadota bacterium]